MNIGILGCGDICDIYCKTINRFPSLSLLACANRTRSKAERVAAEYGVNRIYSPEELFEDAEIDLIVNLTSPDVHFELGMKALKAGKHLYNEKPLTVTMSQARELRAEATTRALWLGCAPDTVLGAGIQTTRKLIDDGAIGTPLTAHAFVMLPGHENWHPNPDFFYKPGAGPLFDLGPYYLSAMVHYFGPIKAVCGVTQTAFAQRTITSKPRAGQVIDVEVPTTITGLLEFASGVSGVLVASFDAKATSHRPGIEIYGTEGTLLAPDPNKFDQPPQLKRRPREEWNKCDMTHSFKENSRGVGVADMVLRKENGHRANAEVAFHVLEAMHALHTSWDDRRWVALESTCARPEPVREDYESTLTK